MEITYADVKTKAKNLRFKNQAFINGHYVASASGNTFDCINPATGQVLTHVAACDREDVDKAVLAARHAFDKGVWSQTAPEKRKQILLAFADSIEKHQLELALLETLDMGKPISDSLNDVTYAVKSLRWNAEIIDKIYDQIAPTDPNVLALITREPIGVVGAVTPWNFPLYLACAKIGPALVTGNSVIIKPAEQSPLTTIFIAELAANAGVPEGVLNVIPGFGETAGQAMGLHAGIDAISFTGSTEVGKLFLKYSADSNMKRVSLECGGKSPNIVLTDCENLDQVAKQSAAGAFFNQGEVCCAPTRLLVADSIRDELVTKLVNFSKEFQPGDPLDPKTVMGAIVDQTQLQRVLKYIQTGKTEGATLVTGGNQVRQDTGGCFVEPTIFSKVHNAMTIAREEIFGPVLSVLSFKDEAEAIKIANDTHYGLAASLWTNDINKAHRIAKALRAGVVSVNCINSGDVTTPFGGYKQSGIGRESSFYGLEHYLEIKTTWIQLS
ncbi:MAG TPA: aldehyde dehydrogenase [Gammaproteobacteria bacterium]|nr:aldehyde dehydrogenase [Gammaproteobacteria bacterium]